MSLLEVTDLRASFHTRTGIHRAVRGVSFAVQPGEIVGLVGESGSGKSVTASALMGLLPQPPARIDGGSARFGGLDLLHGPGNVVRSIRGRRLAMVFQDPLTSLNPHLRIADQVTEPLRIHERLAPAEARRRAIAMLEAVGIGEAAQRIDLYPHEFSGGMCQRVMIAMALITRPELLIADEPTTALDVTVQAQILELIRREQRERGMAVLFITHDLGVVAELCDRVLVMYAGRIVESAGVQALFRHPRHPYTRALLRSVPSTQPKGAELRTIPGLPPDVSRLPPGCVFAPRCEFAVDDCRRRDPPLLELAPGQTSACLRAQAGEILREPEPLPAAAR